MKESKRIICIFKRLGSGGKHPLSVAAGGFGCSGWLLAWLSYELILVMSAKLFFLFVYVFILCFVYIYLIF